MAADPHPSGGTGACSRIGASVRSTDLALFEGLAELARDGMIDHIQLQLIPEPELRFRERMEIFETAGIPILLHAPYHTHGVNPCQPAAYREIGTAEAREVIDAAICQSFEAADRLGSPLIVLHAGTYEEGTYGDAVEEFSAFTDRYRDRRFILENMPAVFRGQQMLGITAAETEQLISGKINGICLDFAHLSCSATYLGRPFAAELDEFEQLPVRHHHLTNTQRGSARDRHCPLDHPDGGLDFSLVIPSLRRRPLVRTSLEYRKDAVFYRRQLACFDHLCREFGDQPNGV
jgi:endonuclease IV